MVTLELTIQRKVAQGWPVIAEQIQPGMLPVRSEGRFQIEPAALLQQVMPRDYGAVLGEALFQGAIRDAFARSLAEAGSRIRLLLFVEAEDLRTLRWERLCGPLDRGWDFLALNQRTLFSLYLPSLTDRRYPPIGLRDLRALVLIASPKGLQRYGLAPFDVEVAATQVINALDGIPSTLLASGPDGLLPGASGPASLEALCESITQQPYTLVHVLCHGQYSQQRGESSIFLADANHQVDRIDSTRLIEQLGRLRGRRGLPHFAFLATCQSAAPAAEGVLGGLAQRLVRELGMPAVIAMTEKVTIETAQLLTGGFYNRLCEHGEVDRALVEATIAIADRSDVTVPAIYSRLGGQPLFSYSLDRSLTPSEIDSGLNAVESLLSERAPILIERFKVAAGAVQRTLSTDLASISQAEHREQQEALDEIDQICIRAIDHSFKALALGQKPPIYDARCPFLGLVAFRIADHAFFFGRDGLIEQLRLRLRQHPFLAVVGPSGCGKSSLIFAGLIPALQAEDGSLDVRTMTPGSNPLLALQAATAQLPETNARVLLVVDQFEELFTLCPDPTQREEFLAQLFSHIHKTGADLLESGDGKPQVSIILTMRADFWGDCATYAQLRDEMLAHQLLIGPMDASELRAAMEQQARLVGLRFEADLANTILDDVRGEPGAMPLLQQGLRELWQRRHGRWLAAEEYRAMGGVHRAIAHTAEVIYNSSSPVEQVRMRNLLLSLTRFDEDILPGQERRHTRRRVLVEDLIPSDAEHSSVIRLISKLADARLVVTGVSSLSGKEEVEVAHEALIREWQRLGDWLDEDIEEGRILRRLREATNHWGNQTEDTGYLYQGERLRRARAWVKEHPDRVSAKENQFIAASVLHERRTLLNRISRGVALFLAPVLLYLFFAYQTERWPFEPPSILWQPVPRFLNLTAGDLVQDSEGTLYATLPYLLQVARSQDNGNHWEVYPMPIVGQDEISTLVAHPSEPGLLFANLASQGLMRSENGGQIWHQIQAGLVITQVGGLAVDPTGVLYAGGRQQGVYFSADQGERWLPIDDAPDVGIRFLSWHNGYLHVGTRRGFYLWSPTEGWQQPTPDFTSTVYTSATLGEWSVAGGTNSAYSFRVDTPPQTIISQTVLSSLALTDPYPIYFGGTTNGTVLWWKPGMAEAELLASNDQFGQAQNINSIHMIPSESHSQLWISTDRGAFLGDILSWLQYHERMHSER